MYITPKYHCIFGVYTRALELTPKVSHLIFGPRQTGKSALIRPNDLYVNLLQETSYLPPSGRLVSFEPRCLRTMRKTAVARV